MTVSADLDRPSGSGAVGMTSILTLPLLNKLVVWGPVDNPDCIIECLHRSNAPLTTLTLNSEYAQLTSARILPLLMSAPRVQNLDIHGRCLTDDIVQRLTYQPGVKSLARCLHHLIIRGHIPCRPKIFTDMVASRRNLGVESWRSI